MVLMSFIPSLVKSGLAMPMKLPVGSLTPTTTKKASLSVMPISWVQVIRTNLSRPRSKPRLMKKHGQVFTAIHLDPLLSRSLVALQLR